MTPREANDHIAITALIYSLAFAMDDQDYSFLRTHFHPNVIGEFATGTFTGIDAIQSQYESFLSNLDATQHMISNVVIDLRGDEASLKCYFQAQHVKNGLEGGNTFLIGGKYEDELRKADEDGGWKIEKRKVRSTWTSGNPGVVGMSLKPKVAVSG